MPPTNTPTPTGAPSHRISNRELDTADMPYVPTKEDLEEWLAYWRGVYPERVAGVKKGDGERAVLGRGKGEGKGEGGVGVVGEGAGKRGQNDMPGTFRSEHESHVDARVRGEWELYSEGLKAMEEGRVEGVLRK